MDTNQDGLLSLSEWHKRLERLHRRKKGVARDYIQSFLEDLNVKIAMREVRV